MLYKNDFPVFNHHKNLYYLDHAATSHKPQVVIDGMKQFYETVNGSPHRGAHDLSIQATEIYDQARSVVNDFINGEDPKSVVFTKNATEALNLISYSYLENIIEAGDEIVLSITNHHSNVLPYQRLVRKRGAKLVYLYSDDQGLIPKSELDKINIKTKVVALPLISNGIGVRHRVKDIFTRATSVGAVKILDAAQAVGHEPVDVQVLEPDLMVFSGHKMYGPQGIGVLYGRGEILNQFHPFLMGGDMIEYVTEQESTYAPVPERLEAGTQNVAGVYGLTLAIKYIQEIGINRIEAHEKAILQKAYDALSALDYVEVYGPQSIEDRGGLITFNVKDVHPHDVSSILNSHHVAIRGGHHCCQPLMKYMNLPSTCRVSFGIYSDQEDLDQLLVGLEEVRKIFHE